MESNFKFSFRLIIAAVFIICISIQSNAQVCDNLALSLDNANPDFISLSPVPVTGAGDFTIEAWFYSNTQGGSCPGSFQTLFSLFGPGPTPHSFEIGMCNGGQMHFFWDNGGPFLAPLSILTTDYSQSCHHIAVTRTGSDVEIYIDGISIVAVLINNNPFAFTSFQVGRGSGLLPSQDWDGMVDEIRIWSDVRTSAEIKDYKDCTLSGSSANLEVNWTFDNDGAIPGGNNSSITQVLDAAAPPDNGTLNGFDLTNGNTTSNYVCSPCAPAIYQVDFSDLISLFPINLVSICQGDYVHLCATESGNPINLPSGAMVMWESSEGGAPFSPDPDLSAYQNAINALCFPIQAGIITANCTNSPLGYVDRKYRARIIKKIGNEICTFTTQDRSLQICCNVTNALLVYAVQPPTPFNGTLCEGPVVVDVGLASTDPWLIPLSPNTSIQWCINGVHDANFDNFTSITYTGQATAPNLCFEVKIQNCSCPLYTINFCITVDPKPMCGVIDGMSPNTLMPDPNGGIYDYLICPGDDAIVGMVNPPDFKNCDPVWQYHFDTDPIGFPNWQDLGTSNSLQNTNTLPHVSLPNNPASPYLWPPGATCIYYRIECRPFSAPSGCDSCRSNEVRICLKQPPPIPVISSTANQICKGDLATLSISSVPGALVYTWYCNGAVIGSGPFLTSVNVMQYACYEVSVFDGCFTVTSSKFCLEVCAIIPIISCPVDNPCACNGLPITLSGCNSYDTCNGTGPLTYSWLADGVPVTGSGPNGCELVHTPNTNGTTYTLTVCNSLNPNCCSTTTLYMEPCM